MTKSTNRMIVSISFLYSDERVRIGVNKKGKFPLPKSTSYGRGRMHSHTALEFVTHEKVRVMDPVLTLSDGTKLRVYQGGDPTYMVVEAASVIENHDNENKITAKPKSQSTIKKPKARTGKISFFNDDQYYEDDYYYDLGFPSLTDYDLDDKD